MENTLIEAYFDMLRVQFVYVDARDTPPNRKRENRNDHEVICTGVI